MYKKKENLGPVSSSKRPKIAESLMVGPNFSSRGRHLLSNSNAGPTPVAAADLAAAAGSDVNVIELNSREDVERLLIEKMKGKNKNDYKMAGLTATQSMTEYEEQKNTIKDLRNRLADAEYQIAEVEKLHN